MLILCNEILVLCEGCCCNQLPHGFGVQHQSVYPYQQWLTYSRITVPFTMPQAAYPCGTIPHILTSLPYTYEWFIRQSGSFRFWANWHRGITYFQKSYKINDLFLCLNWQGGYLFNKDVRSFHWLSHLRLVLTKISCYCQLTFHISRATGDLCSTALPLFQKGSSKITISRTFEFFYCINCSFAFHYFHRDVIVVKYDA